MEIGIYGQFGEVTGSQFRAVEMANGLLEADYSSCIISPNGLHAKPAARLADVPIYKDHGVIQDLDHLIIINGASYGFSKARWWSTRAKLAHLKSISIIYNYVLRPAQYLYTYREMYDGNIFVFTANSEWAKTLKTEERYKKTLGEGVSVHTLNSPIDSDFDIERTHSDQVRIGRLAGSSKHKFKSENMHLVQEFKDMAEFKFMGIPDIYTSQLQSMDIQLHDAYSIPAPEFLSGLDIFLYNVDWPEPWPRVVAEAMMAGCCVITNNAGGMKDQIDHCETGYLCDSIDGFRAVLKMLLSNKKRITEVGEAARQKAREKFSRPKVIERFVNTINIDGGRNASNK